MFHILNTTEGQAVMGYHLSSRWGDDESEASLDRMREVLAELDVDDGEHPSVSLTHESEWCLGAYPDGAIVWENLEEGDPRHMTGVSRDQILKLWTKLASGDLAAVEKERWLPGYPPIDPEELQAEIDAGTASRLRAAREFYDSLGEERSSHPCRKPGCNRGAVKLSVLCRIHHFEVVRGPCPFDD